MDFNIRAISLAESVPFNARTPIGELLGKEIEFRSGIKIAITLPNVPDKFNRLPEAERLLSALDGWARVYVYPEGDDKAMHILAPADGHDGDSEMLVYRVELLQPVRIKPGPRPHVEIVGGAVMTYDACTKWLVDLSYAQAIAHNHSKGSVLTRPCVPKPQQMRIGWVGVEKLGRLSMPVRLRSLGQVFGAEIIHVGPQSFAHVKSRLAAVSPLNAAVICTSAAGYITSAVVPHSVRPDLVHLCHRNTLGEMESELVTLIERTGAALEEERQNQTVDEGEELLRVMLRGMMSHSKIGQCSHCQRETVLTGVRARRLNVAAAERILDKNSEAFQDTKTSDLLFLWKDHNDGRQYFLNSRQVETIKLIVAR